MDFLLKVIEKSLNITKEHIGKTISVEDYNKPVEPM